MQAWSYRRMKNSNKNTAKYVEIIFNDTIYYRIT